MYAEPTILKSVAIAHDVSTTNASSFLPTDRTKRVKDARSEAQKEIEEYRNQKEEEFKQFESQVYIHIPHLSLASTAVSLTPELPRTAHIWQQESRRRRGQGDKPEAGRDQGHWEEDRA